MPLFVGALVAYLRGDSDMFHPFLMSSMAVVIAAGVLRRRGEN